MNSIIDFLVSYHVKDLPHKQNPSFSFGYKSDKCALGGQINEVPGPGAYYDFKLKKNKSLKSKNETSTNLKQMEQKVNSEEKQKRIQEIIIKMKQSPGPGDYFPKDVVQSLAHSQKFGIADREDIPKDKSLGPGIYNPENSLTNSKKGFSILGRFPEKPNTSIIENPGPGSYNPKEISTQQTCQFMSTRRQIIPDSLAYPGPGTYNIEMKKPLKKRSTFGTSLRQAFNSSHGTPGVGNYELRLKISGPTIPFIGKKDNFALPDSIQYPGPGKYLDASLTTTNPKFGFGLKIDTKIKQSPGPGQYSINRDLEGQQYSFGQKHFDIYSKNNPPGPGSYEIQSNIAAMPNYLNSSKISLMNLSKTIGDESLELQNQILGN